MDVALFVGALVALWAGAALHLSCLPWFQRRDRPSLVERLRPFVTHHEREVETVQNWLDLQWRMRE